MAADVGGAGETGREGTAILFDIQEDNSYLNRIAPSSSLEREPDAKASIRPRRMCNDAHVRRRDTLEPPLRYAEAARRHRLVQASLAPPFMHIHALPLSPNPLLVTCMRGLLPHVATASFYDDLINIDCGGPHRSWSAAEVTKKSMEAD